MSYSTLQLGSSGADVRTLKRLLGSAGFSLSDNDQFDEATSQAVSDYQSQHQLPVSGTANAATWAKLAANIVPSMAANASGAAGVKYLESNRPAAYTSAYAEKLDSMLDQVLNREKFSYDPAQDELYNRYRDQYLYLGRRAMNDARGSAAALTGGYNNSFAEAAGQQAYQNHIAQLAGELPELYKLALSAYDAETGRLMNGLNALSDADNTAYSRYQDDLTRYNDALKYYNQKMKDEKKTARAASSSAASASAAPAVDTAAIQKALPNIYTQSEFERRKASGAASVAGYATYADYCAAMKKKYNV